MTIDRNRIYKITDVVRQALSLGVPVTFEELRHAIEMLNGRCVPKACGELNVDAQISTCNTGEYQFEIKYLENKPETRILFSIAHELGHLFLHLLQENGTLKTAEIFERNMETTKEELEANEFAAELLMPVEMFIIKCRELLMDDKVNITKVARYFNVSVQAVTVRGNVLGLW